MGYSVGLMLGYKLNKHFSLEVAAIYANKKYYTDGKYFDKTGADIPSAVTLNHLDGGCQMFEFPLSVRYNLKKSFFATAGLTSYLMKKESYDYSATAYGATYYNYKTYNNSGNYLFSNAQLSLGYDYKLSTKINIRIEPYIKIPVKNIGIGKMPITSTGLYLGITRNIK